jgi:hypothetical protein
MHLLAEKANMPMRETGHTTSCEVYKLSRKVQHPDTNVFQVRFPKEHLVYLNTHLNKSPIRHG